MWRVGGRPEGNGGTFCFVEVCRIRGLKINAGKSRVTVLNREDGLECEVSVDGVRLDHGSKFKYTRCVLNESGTEEADFSRKEAIRRRVAGAIWLMIEVCSLSVLRSCTRHCSCLILCMVVRQYGDVW